MITRVTSIFPSRKQDPQPTWDHSLPLSSRQSNIWKGCTGRLWIFNFFFFSFKSTYCCNLSKHSHTAKHVGVQLRRPSTRRLSGSWFPLTWELSLRRAGNPEQRGIPWPLQLPFSKLGWGRGGGWSICVHWNVSDSQWKWNLSWKTFGKSSLLFPPLRDLQSNQDIKG